MKAAEDKIVALEGRLETLETDRNDHERRLRAVDAAVQNIEGNLQGYWALQGNVTGLVGQQAAGAEARRMARYDSPADALVACLDRRGVKAENANGTVNILSGPLSRGQKNGTFFCTKVVRRVFDNPSVPAPGVARSRTSSPGTSTASPAQNPTVSAPGPESFRTGSGTGSGASETDAAAAGRKTAQSLQPAGSVFPEARF
ncbi:MAG: hypothetical protein M3O22_07320 [Pseudomonadota bacterium]|nr:hypothetical protein [Pseudomonadota bacterium]